MTRNRLLFILYKLKSAQRCKLKQNRDIAFGYLHVCLISSQLNKPQIFLCSSAGKEFACNAEAPIQSLSQEDPLEKGTVTHSSILAWRIPWTEELDRRQSMG